MAVIQKATGRATSMAAGLAIGALWSPSIVLLGAGLVAKLIEGEVLPESSMGYGVMILLIAASYVGSKVSAAKIKRQRLVVCLASGVILFGILLSITALFFGGQYSAVGVTALLILCGSGLAMLPERQAGRGAKGRKIKIPNR